MNVFECIKWYSNINCTELNKTEPLATKNAAFQNELKLISALIITKITRNNHKLWYLPIKYLEEINHKKSINSLLCTFFEKLVLMEEGENTEMN